MEKELKEKVKLFLSVQSDSLGRLSDNQINKLVEFFVKEIKESGDEHFKLGKLIGYNEGLLEGAKTFA